MSPHRAPRANEGSRGDRVAVRNPCLFVTIRSIPDSGSVGGGVSGEAIWRIGVQGHGGGRALTTTIVGLLSAAGPIACRRAVDAGEPLHRGVRQPSGWRTPRPVVPLSRLTDFANGAYALPGSYATAGIPRAKDVHAATNLDLLTVWWHWSSLSRPAVAALPMGWRFVGRPSTSTVRSRSRGRWNTRTSRLPRSPSMGPS